MPEAIRPPRSLTVCLAVPALIGAGLWMGGAFAAQPAPSTVNTAGGPATPYPDGMRVDLELPSNEQRSRLMLEGQTGVVRLHSVVVTSGQVRITETGTGRSLGFFSGGDWSDEHSRFTGSDQVFLGGLPVRGPIEVTELSGRRGSSTTVHVYFWNQPDAP